MAISTAAGRTTASTGFLDDSFGCHGLDVDNSQSPRSSQQRQPRRLGAAVIQHVENRPASVESMFNIHQLQLQIPFGNSLFPLLKRGGRFRLASSLQLPVTGRGRTNDTSAGIVMFSKRFAENFQDLSQFLTAFGFHNNEQTSPDTGILRLGHFVASHLWDGPIAHQYLCRFRPLSRDVQFAVAGLGNHVICCSFRIQWIVYAVLYSTDPLTSRQVPAARRTP